MDKESRQDEINDLNVTNFTAPSEQLLSLNTTSQLSMVCPLIRDNCWVLWVQKASLDGLNSYVGATSETEGYQWD